MGLVQDLRGHTLSDDILDGLPEDPEAAFIHIENLCRTDLNSSLRSLDQDDQGLEFKSKYMTDVFAATLALELDELTGMLELPTAGQIGYSEWVRFRQAIDLYITQARIRSARRNRQLSVQLNSGERQKIDHYISLLRASIDESALPDKKKGRLHEKLDELAKELTRTRVSLSISLAIVASVLVIVHESQGLVVDAPKFLESITYFLGKAKEQEIKDGAGRPDRLKAIEGPKAARAALPRPDTAPRADEGSDDPD